MNREGGRVERDMISIDKKRPQIEQHTIHANDARAKSAKFNALSRGQQDGEVDKQDGLMGGAPHQTQTTLWNETWRSGSTLTSTVSVLGAAAA